MSEDTQDDLIFKKLSEIKQSLDTMKNNIFDHWYCTTYTFNMDLQNNMVDELEHLIDSLKILKKNIKTNMQLKRKLNAYKDKRNGRALHKACCAYKRTAP